MFVLKIGDVVIDDPDELNYFTNLYATDNNYLENDLFDQVIPSLITKEENEVLGKNPSREEIKETIFSMNGDGAPSPDGYGGCFFLALLGYWWN